MSDFTILRFHECSENLLSQLAKSRKWIFFWCCAILLVFFNLGLDVIAGSEGRWFAVVREMLLSGDWLHPTINGQPYFDKPLVSYWFMAFLSKAVNQGVLNEFLARAPSAIFALLAMVALIRLARRLYGESAAWLAAWIFLTVYPFAYWGRRAEADMESLAFILIAVTWYVASRETKSFFRYFLFWLVCAIGAQTKGLPCFAVPVGVVLVDVAVRNAWLKHLNWKFLLAFLCGMACYFLPFLAEGMTQDGGYDADGLTLVFRENVVRAFNPWDHKDSPWFMYFPWTARLMLPWTPFFVLALAAFLMRGWKKASQDDRWLVLSIVLIFAMFAISESRRVYYILPIVPFCVLLTAAWLTRVDLPLHRLTEILFRIVDFAIPVALLLGLLAAPLYPFAIHDRIFPEGVPLPYWYPPMIYILFPAVAFACLCFWIVSYVRERKGRKALCTFSPLHASLNRIVPILAVSFLLVFAVVIPTFRGSPVFQPEREFFRAAGKYVRTLNLPEGSVGFFGKNRASAGLSFYLDLPEPMRLFAMKKIDAETRSFYDDTVESGGIEELRAFIAEAKKNGGVLIAEKRTVMEAPEDVQAEFRALDVAMEPLNIMETKKIREYQAKGRADKVESVLKKKTLIRYYFPPKGTKE